MSMRALQACPLVSITLHEVLRDDEPADTTAAAGRVVDQTVTVSNYTTTSARTFAFPWTVVRPVRDLLLLACLPRL